MLTWKRKVPSEFILNSPHNRSPQVNRLLSVDARGLTVTGDDNCLASAPFSPNRTSSHNTRFLCLPQSVQARCLPNRTPSQSGSDGCDRKCAHIRLRQTENVLSFRFSRDCIAGTLLIYWSETTNVCTAKFLARPENEWKSGGRRRSTSVCTSDLGLQGWALSSRAEMRKMRAPDFPQDFAAVMDEKLRVRGTMRANPLALSGAETLGLSIDRSILIYFRKWWEKVHDGELPQVSPFRCLGCIFRQRRRLMINGCGRQRRGLRHETLISPPSPGNVGKPQDYRLAVNLTSFPDRERDLGRGTRILHSWMDWYSLRYCRISWFSAFLYIGKKKQSYL